MSCYNTINSFRTNMRTYSEALEYSKKNPTELVEFKKIYSNELTYLTGFFLNGKQEGVFEYFSNCVLLYSDVYNSKRLHSETTCFWSDGSVESCYFRKNKSMHGEHIEFNKDGTIESHYFTVNSYHITELDYLLDADRDDAFYVTLALYGIDKEYTF